MTFLKLNLAHDAIDHEDITNNYGSYGVAASKPILNVREAKAEMMFDVRPVSNIFGYG